MKKSRFTEEQFVHALRQVEMGTPAVEVCRRAEVSEQTFCRWTPKVAGMHMVERRRLRQIEEESRTRMPRVACLTLGRHMRQAALRNIG